MTWYIIYEYFGKKRREMIGIADSDKEARRISRLYSQSIIDKYETDGERDTIKLMATYNCNGEQIITE